MNGEWDYVFHLTLDEAVICLAVIVALVIASGILGGFAGRWSRASEVAQLGRSIASLVHQSREPKGGPPNIR